ncbi:MAG TPA: V-type ATP synthase subunit E [Candidatus Acidoferrales bacterium]|nr:V-type ATP synthase subunit E [Candidatus Acidoferrales bacterium]
MGLREILQAMEVKAHQQIAERESAAEQESRSIIERAEAEAKRIKEAHRAMALEKLRRERERLFDAAQLDRQRQLAVAREHWLDRVLAQARRELMTLRSSDDYGRGYERLVCEAANEIPSAVKLEIDPRDQQLARQILDTRGIEGELVPCLDTSGGVRVSSLDGCIVVNNTVEARLDNAWRELRQKLVALLSAEESLCPATTDTPTRASARSSRSC